MVSPANALSVKSVVYTVIRRNCEGNSIGGFGTGERQTATFCSSRVDRVEVKVDVPVQVVNVYAAVAVELGDFVVGVWREEVLEGFIQGADEGKELRR